MIKVRALGVDQGIANCGYALIDIKFEINDVNKDKENIPYKITTIESGVLETESRLTMSNRTYQIYDKTKDLIKKHKPDIIGCEQLFLNKNQRSIGMLYVNMATGILFSLSGEFKIPIVELVPGTVKKTITGDGQASKDDVIKEITLKLNENNENDFVNNEHIADAFGIALTAGMELFKNEDYYNDLRESIIYEYTDPNKRKPIKLLKSEATKLKKMRDICKYKNLTSLDISKKTGITKPTVEKYINEINDGVMDYLIQKEKDEKNNVLDKYK